MYIEAKGHTTPHFSVRAIDLCAAAVSPRFFDSRPIGAQGNSEVTLVHAALLTATAVMIKGNEDRLIVVIAYRMQCVYVKFIGTHAEYDKVDAAVVALFKGV